MRKFTIGYTALCISTGIVGYVVRKIQIPPFNSRYVLLRTSGNTSSLILALATAFVLIAMAVALLIKRRTLGEPQLEYNACFGGSFYSLIAVFGYFVFWLGGAGFLIVRGVRAESTQHVVLGILSIPCGFISARLGLITFLRRYNEKHRWLNLAIIAFMICWLLIFYRSMAAYPFISGYAYELLAIVFGLLSFYYQAGIAYGRGKYYRTLFCLGATIHFALTGTANRFFASYAPYFGALVTMSFTNLLLLCDRGKKLASSNND